MNFMQFLFLYTAGTSKLKLFRSVGSNQGVLCQLTSCLLQMWLDYILGKISFSNIPPCWYSFSWCVFSTTEPQESWHIISL